MAGVDIVTVPDFQSPLAEVFEARTLLYLGSWLENAGTARDWPLHLACIGEPPPSVRALAAECGAEISIHEPRLGGKTPTQNKLRAFDVTPRADRFLLLDTDVVFLSDPSSLLELGPSLSVAPAGNNRVRPAQWEKVCGALGEPIPAERVMCLRGELADRLPRRARGEARHREPMPPYYNTAVLLVPWVHAKELLEHWVAYLDRLAEIFPVTDKENYTLSRSNQLGFTFARERMRGTGLEFRDLPYRFHGAWLHYMADALDVESTVVYHTVHMLRLGDPAAPLDVMHEIDLYEDRILEAVYPPGLAGRLRSMLARRTGEAAGVRELRRLCERIRELARRWVLPRIGAAA